MEAPDNDVPFTATLDEIVADIRETRDNELNVLRRERDDLLRELRKRPLREVIL